MSQICYEKYINIWFGFHTEQEYHKFEKIHEKFSTFCPGYGLIYIDDRNIRGLHLCQDNPHLLESGKKVLCNNFILNLNSKFLMHLFFAIVGINNNIADERYRSSSHCLTKTDSSTTTLSICSCDLSKENKIINLVNEATISPLMRTLQICYLRLKS